MGTLVAIPNPTSVYLYVPAFTLSSGVEYAFQIYVWTTDSGGQTVGSLNQTFTVTVEDEPVIATCWGSSGSVVAMGSWLVFDVGQQILCIHDQAQLFVDSCTWPRAPNERVDFSGQWFKAPRCGLASVSQHCIHHHSSGNGCE